MAELDYREMWYSLRKWVDSESNRRFHTMPKEHPSNVLDEVSRMMVSMVASGLRSLAPPAVPVAPEAAPELSPEEADGIAQGLKEIAAGKSRSIAEIRRDLATGEK